eukprot:1335996-Amphidinium_carterae.2
MSVRPTMWFNPANATSSSSASRMLLVKCNPPQLPSASEPIDLVRDLTRDVEQPMSIVPASKKAKPSPATTDLRSAVRDVYRRRHQAGITEHIAYETVVREAMKNILSVGSSTAFNLASRPRLVTSKQKAMRRPKVHLTPAAAKDIPNPVASPQNVNVPLGTGAADSPCSSSLWMPCANRWDSHPNRNGGI